MSSILGAERSDRPSKSFARSAWRIVRDEPLIHFLFLAALLFVTEAVWTGDDREVIAVDRATQEYLIKQRQDLLLRPVTDGEKEEVIESFIEDEMLFREARKRGFDDSARVRQLLVQNMRFFLAGDIPKPTEDDLRKFFNENRQRFENPPSLSFDHVFFANPDEAPADILTQLNGGADPSRIGDITVSFGKRIMAVGKRRLTGFFGPDETSRILAIENSDWHGPFLSRQGAHFLKVSARNPARIPTFEQARTWIDTEWIAAKHREIVDREMDTIRQGYRVEIEPSGENGK